MHYVHIYLNYLLSFQTAPHYATISVANSRSIDGEQRSAHRYALIVIQTQIYMSNLHHSLMFFYICTVDFNTSLTHFKRG